MHRKKILIMKSARCTKFSNLFWNENLHVSGSSSVHCHEFFTVHTTMVNVIHVCWQFASRIRTEHSDPACKLSVKLRKFEKLVHPVGFIVRNKYTYCIKHYLNIPTKCTFIENTYFYFFITSLLYVSVCYIHYLQGESRITCTRPSKL